MFRRFSCTILLFMLSGCNSLLFFPQREYVLTPSDLHLEYEEIRIPVADRVELAAWFLPHQSGTALKGTILFLHGNAENISTHIFSIRWLPGEGYDVYALDYRGFGASDGSVSLNRSVEDSRKVIGFLREKTGGPIIVFGQSLGASIAIPAIAPPEVQQNVSAAILESPVSSYRSIAREKLGLLWLTWPIQWPLSFLLSDEFAPDRWITQLHIPILLVHSKADEVVPFDNSLKLYELIEAKDKVTFIPFEGERHVQIFHSRAARESFLNFLTSSQSKAPALLNERGGR